MTTHREPDAAGHPNPSRSHGDERGGAASLADALIRLRAAVAQTRYPLNVPSATAAREAGRQFITRIDDYLVPRVSRRDAALLVVVAGPTGSGKSTLVNSLVRAPVSRTGVLRPTTVAPVLVCHPNDMPWFAQRPLLPGLPRTSGVRTDPHSLRLVSAPGLASGLALLDAPDVDSVIDTNRAFADRLLAAADLWLFVTTAARYADAVPWTVLRRARDQGTAVAVVLNRVPAGAEDEVGGDFGAMLDEQAMGHVHLFVLPEVRLDGQGLLADRLVDPLRGWVMSLADDPGARADVIAQTMSGALAGVDELLRRLALAADDQVAAAAELDRARHAGFDEVPASVAAALRDGTLLRGEVRARWQELVADGRRRLPGEPLCTALVKALASLLDETVLAATERVRAAWASRPEGRALLDEVPPVASGQLTARVVELVRDWERELLTLAGKPGACPLVLTLALLDGVPEVAKVLGGRLATPGLVDRARTALLDRVPALVSAVSDPYRVAVDAVRTDPNSAAHLRNLARTIGEGHWVPEGRRP